MIVDLHVVPPFRMHGGLFPVPNLSYIVVVLVVKYIHSLTFLTFESGVIEMALHVKCA